jgi:acyl carrier protein
MPHDETDDILARVLGKAAELAAVDPESIDRASSLETLGLDSSDAVVLAMEIEEATGVEIDVGIFLRFETIGEAADEIARLIASGQAAVIAQPSGGA